MYVCMMRQICESFIFASNTLRVALAAIYVRCYIYCNSTEEHCHVTHVGLWALEERLAPLNRE